MDLQLDIEQSAFGDWDPLRDLSMSCGVGPRATSDRKPNWWLQDVVVGIREEHASCGDLPLLQGVSSRVLNLYVASYLDELTAIRKKIIVSTSDADDSQDACMGTCLPLCHVHRQAVSRRAVVVTLRRKIVGEDETMAYARSILRVCTNVFGDT